MTKLYEDFKKVVSDFKKIMKLIGIHVIDENYKLLNINLSVCFLLFIFINVLAFYSFYVAFEKNNFESIIKTSFTIGYMLEVRSFTIFKNI